MKLTQFFAATAVLSALYVLRGIVILTQPKSFTTRGTMDFNPQADNEEIYDKKIAPLMEEIMNLCQKYGIPVVASFQYSEHALVNNVSLAPNCHDVLMELGSILYPEKFTVVPDTDKKNEIN